MSLHIFEGIERNSWRLPCFRRADCIVLSDSQLKYIRIDDLPRHCIGVILKGASFVDALERSQKK